MRRATSFCVISLALILGPLAVHAETDARVRAGVELYQSGQYAQARDALVTTVGLPALSSRERQRARVFLAAAYHALGDAASARAQLLAVAREVPNLVLDPNDFPAELVALADEARLEVAQEPQPPERARPHRLSPRDLTTALPIDAPHVSPPPLPSPPSGAATLAELPPLGTMFVPFGVGQFALDEDLKGTVFLSSQVVTLGASAVALAMFESNKTSGGFYAGGTFRDPQKAQTLQTIHLVSAYTALALMVGGVLDAVTTRSLLQSSATGDGASAHLSGQGLLIRF